MLDHLGTPDMAAQIERLERQSNGGFGAYLVLVHEWADPDATRRSVERACAVREELAGQQQQAVDAMKAKYEAERSVRH